MVAGHAHTFHKMRSWGGTVELVIPMALANDLFQVVDIDV